MTAFDSWLAQQAKARDEAGLRRTLASQPEDFIDLAGNDYLGLSRHPDVVDGAVGAVIAYGAGAGASRLVTGTLALHEQLESALAAFVGTQTSVVFSTGYHANLSVLSALVDEDTLVVSDAHVHASMIDGCRLARAHVEVAAHNDIDAIAGLLTTRRRKRALVLAESIYSVLGDAAPVSDLVELCERLDALLVIDEAHGLGVAGPRGEGLLASRGLADHPNVLITGTLSKSLGSQGGVVLCSSAIREQLVNRARPFIYDTGLAPAATGGALAALSVVQREPERVARVKEVARALAHACRARPPAGAVLAVPMPTPRAALASVESAAASGVRIGCFRPPSTPDGVSRLRLTAHADLNHDDLARAADVLSTVIEVHGEAAA